MNVHIFTANRYHLVPNIIKNLLKYMPDNQYYLLVGDEKTDAHIYEEIFLDYNYKQFTVIRSFMDLVLISRQFKKDNIVLHAGSYHWMLYFVISGFDSVNWLCWGAGARTSKNYKSRIFSPIKKFIYQRFNRIGVLMDQDAESLKTDFGVNNIFSLAYFDATNIFPYTEENLYSKKAFSGIIYLGNNSSCIYSYGPIVERLSRFKDHLTVQCMANYSFTENEISLQLRNLGYKLFGEKFKLDTDFYSIEEYYKYMDRCDVYICDIEKQSGLGAIYTSLRLGKKVFLSGKNYEWISSLGCHIFSTDNIERMSFDEFEKGLSIEQKIENYNLINQLLDTDKLKNKWKEFLH